MIDFVKVGEKIINCRKKQNLTQEDIAEKLFVSRQLVSKWENGTGVPSIDVLIELSKLFKISISSFMFELFSCKFSLDAELAPAICSRLE